MNANQIHLYEDYAIAEFGKPNGNEFIPNAIRVKVFRILGVVEYGKQRETSYIEGLRCDTETGDPTTTTYSKFRARDVIADWDEWYDAFQQYEVEQSRIQREWQVREEERRRELEKLDAERRERDEQLRRRREAIKAKFAEKDIHSVYISNSGRIEIPIGDMEKFLGITREDIIKNAFVT